MKKINSSMCGDFDYSCDAKKSAITLSKTLSPLKGQFILGNYLLGYGGRKVNMSDGLYTYPGDIRTYYSKWLPRFFLGQISETKPTVFVEQNELSEHYQLIVNTDKKIVGFHELDGIYVKHNDMPILPMNYWIGSDEDLIEFNRALPSKIEKKPIEKMLTTLILEKIWDDEIHSIEYWILEGKIRAKPRKIDESIKYANQVKDIIPNRDSEASMIRVEEEKVKSVLV